MSFYSILLYFILFYSIGMRESVCWVESWACCWVSVLLQVSNCSSFSSITSTSRSSTVVHKNISPLSWNKRIWKPPYREDVIAFLETSGQAMSDAEYLDYCWVGKKIACYMIYCTGQLIHESFCKLHQLDDET